MYKIVRSENKIERLKECSFEELQFKERKHIQEWIAKKPDVFGEELLIIQKEFAGFSDTNERLDLLALDKQGSLVIIENKRDDTGRDVTWQALKYTSYCSTLSKNDIKNIYQEFLNGQGIEGMAESNLSEFFDEKDYEELELNQDISQRIILVAAKYRKEVTSTVLWLLNHKIRIQCFRITPYSMGEGQKKELFLNVEQIIPIKDAEEYMISMAEKSQDNIESHAELEHGHRIRKEFWALLLQDINSRTTLFQNISPSKKNWLSAGTGIKGISYNFSITRNYGCASLYIKPGDKEECRKIFNRFYKQKEEIEKAFGEKLIWDQKEDRRSCQIKMERPGNVFDGDQWSKMRTSMIDDLLKLEIAIKNSLKELNNTSD